jgi:hypothetical protein
MGREYMFYANPDTVLSTNMPRIAVSLGVQSRGRKRAVNGVAGNKDS